MKKLLGQYPHAIYFIAGFLLSLAVSLQSYLQDHKLYANGNYHNRYNNYTVFKSSFGHLKDKQDLYVNYNNEHFDLYKYTPTFALFMAPFYYLPDSIGLVLWNALNVLVLVYALSRIEFFSSRMKLFAFLFILPEIVTSTQNSQSNVLIAGLMILSFVYLRVQRPALASLMLLVAAFIKPFALAGFIVFLFFPGKVRMAAWSLLFAALLLAAPLVLIGWSDLQWQYGNWRTMLEMDHSVSYGISVQGWLHTWFGTEPGKAVVLLCGLFLLLLPLAAVRLYGNERYRLWMLASVLLWVILFNHKSESPTFIIAVSGIAIWYFTQRPQWLNTALVIFAFLFTALIATDVFPHAFRNNWAEPYVIKMFPCLLVWLKIQCDIFRLWQTGDRTVPAT